jgi:hypothetical protein
MVRFDGADVAGADLSEASFNRANFSGADLTATHLVWTMFRGGLFTGANFSDALLLGTIFAEVDLSRAKGLDAVQHRGPSTIGLDTIYASKGEIPERFLRNAGVSENFVAYMKSLTGTALDLYSCFISYSTKDQDFAERLHADLQAKRVRCWFAPHDVKGGRKLHEQIDEAIHLNDRLLLILSEYSINSEWVKREIRRAREKERRENRQVLFPIRLVTFEKLKSWELIDPATGEDLANTVREYFIPDFSSWKDHDSYHSYQSAFQRLLRDLKAEGGKNGD